MKSAECKIVFRDGDLTRAIRGVITSEDNFFITIQRRDGFLRLNKTQVLKIEKWNSSDQAESVKKDE